MKKFFLIIFIVFSSITASALPLGNPAEASLFTNSLWFEAKEGCSWCDPCCPWWNALSFRVGFYGDYVFERHLNSRNTIQTYNKRLQHTNINTSAGYFVLNFCNRIDAFVTLGATHLASEFDARAVRGSALSRLAKIDYNTTFSWSVGGRATLFECDCFFLGVEGQYFRTRPSMNYYFESFALDPQFFYQDDVRATYTEWQVGLGVSYRIATSCPIIALVPFIGFKWNQCSLIQGPFTFIEDEIVASNPFGATGDKRWGWAVGTTFTLCDLAGVTVEGRWGNESALYVNGQVRF